MSVTKRSDKFEDVAHAGFFVSIEDSSEVPQVWRLRSEGSWTSHNGSSVNFLGDDFLRGLHEETLGGTTQSCCEEVAQFRHVAATHNIPSHPMPRTRRFQD